MKLNINNLKYYKQGRKDAIEEFSEKIKKVINDYNTTDFWLSPILHEIDKIKKELQ